MSTSESFPQRVVLFGWPVDHSLSPLLHGAAFEALGLHAWRYERCAVPPERFAEEFARVDAEGLVGANFTLPHKLRALEVVDRVEEEARALGAINCMYREGDERVGTNTDVLGIVESLDALGFRLDGGRVVVVGAGGAARAAVAAAARCGAEEVRVLSRRERAAAELVSALGPYVRRERESVRLSSGGIDDATDEKLEGARLLVNATPCGMTDPGVSPVPLASLAAVDGVFDCVYRTDATPTALVRAGRDQCEIAVDGAEMLIHQGAAAFRRWTGRTTPVVETMRRALDASRS